MLRTIEAENPKKLRQLVTSTQNLLVLIKKVYSTILIMAAFYSYAAKLGLITH